MCRIFGIYVGTAVPLGYYDEALAGWTAEPNGLVIQVLRVNDGGNAQLDLDGSGNEATPEALAAAGITLAEQAQLAGLFPVGTSFWRFQVTHFSTYDGNFGGSGGGPDPTGGNGPTGGAGGGRDAGAGDGGGPPPPLPPDNDCQQSGGSSIGCESQSLSEEIPLAGTPYTLHYSSFTQLGRGDAFSVSIPVVYGDLPPSLAYAEIDIAVAGETISRRFNNPSFPLEAGTTYYDMLQSDLWTVFTWDGKDKFGTRRPRRAADHGHFFLLLPGLLYVVADRHSRRVRSPWKRDRTRRRTCDRRTDTNRPSGKG